MAKVRVQHDRLTRYSALLMIALGVLTWLFVNGELGGVLAVIGLVMYWIYRRQSPRAAPRKSGTSPA